MTGQYSGGMPWQQPPLYPEARTDRRSPRHKLAVAALVLGVLAVLCCGLTGIPAVVVGLLALTSSQRPLPRRLDRDDGLAAVGAALGALTSLALVVVIALTSPDNAESKDDGRPDDGSPSAPATATSSPSAEPSASEKPSAVPKIKRYRVVKVLDPVTIVVAYRGETTIRVVGIEAPRRKPEECFGRESHRRARALLDGKLVELTFDSPPRRDARGQLLAQLILPRERDFGLTMLDGGYAAVSSDPGRVASDYRDVVATAKAAGAGLWGSCGRPHALVAPPQPDPPEPPEEPAGNCDPNYSPCIPAYPPDLDCADTGSVTVTGADPHGLDRDGDGVACGSD